MLYDTLLMIPIKYRTNDTDKVQKTSVYRFVYRPCEVCIDALLSFE